MKSTLKKISTLTLLLAVLWACGSDKQQELIKLNKAKKELDKKIAELEKEIEADTTIVAPINKGISVIVEELETTTFKHYVEIHGKLDGEENVQLYAKGQGVIQQVNAKLGDRVTKGQVIATLDAGALQKSYEQAKAQADLANEMFERQERLWKQNIGSEVQYLQAKSTKEASEQGIAALEEQLDYMRIKSPINGTIEDLPLKVGMAVSPAMPVATVINFSSTKVIAEVAEAYGNRIESGDAVTVIFPDLNKQIDAKVTTASNYISPVNRSFKIEVRLPSLKSNYKANMIAVLKIVDYNKEDAISIPVNLIQTDTKGNYVYVAKAKNEKYIAEKKYIQQGMSYNGVVEITSGLSKGDKVITSGHLTITQGTVINF